MPDRRLLWGVAIIMAAAVSLFASLAVVPPRVAKPQFVPGSRLTIELGPWTIEGTLEQPTTASIHRVNRIRKGDRLDRPPVRRSNGPTCSPLTERKCVVI